MKNQFVPYQQASQLKELGFDEPCITKFERYFNKTKLQAVLATLSLNTPYENEYHGYDQKIINDTEKRWNFTGYKNSVKDHGDQIVAAPLWQQAFDWFREKHKLWGRLSFNNKEDYLFDIIKPGYDIVNGETKLVYGSNYYPTYEDAQQACLEKLIEIVKQK